MMYKKNLSKVYKKKRACFESLIRFLKNLEKKMYVMRNSIKL